jgi:hypothetical protein
MPDCGTVIDEKIRLAIFQACLLGCWRLVNEAFLSPKGIHNAAQGCGATATLG